MPHTHDNRRILNYRWPWWALLGHAVRLPPSPEELAAALSRTSLEWKLKQDKEAYGHCFLHVDDVPDAIVMSMTIDPIRCRQPDVEACLRGMDAVAVSGIADPQAPTR